MENTKIIIVTIRTGHSKMIIEMPTDASIKEVIQEHEIKSYELVSVEFKTKK